MPDTPTVPPAAADDDLPMLPIGFSIAGVQKAATTTLSGLLDRHRSIRRAPQKELAIFDKERIDWSTVTRDSFSERAKTPAHRIMGDATPSYLWWPRALERLHAYNPDVRVIALFRDPIERLFSQWVMNTSRWPHLALDWPDFLTYLRPDTLDAALPDDPERPGERIDGWTFKLHSGVVRGYYGAQLRRAWEVFGQEQVKALEFHDFLGHHERVLDELTDFLGIPRYRRHPELTNAFQGKPLTFGTAPTAADVDGLVDTYRADFEDFREISGLDTSRWAIHRILEGGLTSAELAEKLSAKIGGPFSELPRTEPRPPRGRRLTQA